MAFPTIDPDLLVTATGGANNNNNNHPDFASRYVNNIRQDWNDAQNRANNVVRDARNGNWGGAAKNFGAQVLDNVGLIGDAIAPFRALGG